MTVKSFKRFRMTEISGVDSPAQQLAQVVIMKRADDPDHKTLVDNARAIDVQGPTAAKYTAAQFESGMMAAAKRQASEKGTTPEYELANGWSDSTSDLRLLGKAWNLMGIVEYRPEVTYQ